MLSVLITWVKAHMGMEDGQDLVEYAALGGLIAAAIVAALVSGVLTDAIDLMAGNISDCIDFSSTTQCVGGI